MIEQEQAQGTLSVADLCDILDVSPSGYYAWRKRGKSAHQQADEALGERIGQVFTDSRQTYGSPRIQRALREHGLRTSRKRVARWMQERGLRSVRARKRRRGLTKAGHEAYVVPNLLAQDFTATRRNEKWVTDTTYIPTREGWLYLVSVMDLYNRQVVGWALGEQYDATLAIAALDMAIRRERPQPGLIVHSHRRCSVAGRSTCTPPAPLSVPCLDRGWVDEVDG